MSAFHSSFQHTLAAPAMCEGIGLHSGQPVKMTLTPAPEGSGIVFQRIDVLGAQDPFVSAYHTHVSDTRLGTTITNGSGISVSTIEHLMAALWGAGVDNLLITIDGPEVPIMDGSSEPFMALIADAGLQEQAARRQVVEVLKPVTVMEGDSKATLEPYDGFALQLVIDFDDNVVARQSCTYDFTYATFKDALARARTFGFVHEVEYLRSMGLARGGSLENAIVVGKDGVMNEGGLRFDNEFARHKALDCVGDLFLAGGRLRGKVTAYRPGHMLNARLLTALFADRAAWRLAPVAQGEKRLAAVAAFAPIFSA